MTELSLILEAVLFRPRCVSHYVKAVGRGDKELYRCLVIRVIDSGNQ